MTRYICENIDARLIVLKVKLLYQKRVANPRRQSRALGNRVNGKNIVQRKSKIAHHTRPKTFMVIEACRWKIRLGT